MSWTIQPAMVYSSTGSYEILFRRSHYPWTCTKLPWKTGVSPSPSSIMPLSTSSGFAGLTCMFDKHYRYQTVSPAEWQPCMRTPYKSVLKQFWVIAPAFCQTISRVVSQWLCAVRKLLLNSFSPGYVRIIMCRSQNAATMLQKQQFTRVADDRQTVR